MCVSVIGKSKHGTLLAELAWREKKKVCILKKDTHCTLYANEKAGKITKYSLKG